MSVSIPFFPLVDWCGVVHERSLPAFKLSSRLINVPYKLRGELARLGDRNDSGESTRGVVRRDLGHGPREQST